MGLNKNKSNHFISRVIGSVEQKRNGVEIEKIIDTLREPDEITNVEVRASGSTQRFKNMEWQQYLLILKLEI